MSTTTTTAARKPIKHQSSRPFHQLAASTLNAGYSRQQMKQILIENYSVAPSELSKKFFTTAELIAWIRSQTEEKPKLNHNVANSVTVTQAEEEEEALSPFSAPKTAAINLMQSSIRMLRQVSSSHKEFRRLLITHCWQLTQKKQIELRCSNRIPTALTKTVESVVASIRKDDDFDIIERRTTDTTGSTSPTTGFCIVIYCPPLNVTDSQTDAKNTVTDLTSIASGFSSVLYVFVVSDEQIDTISSLIDKIDTRQHHCAIHSDKMNTDELLADIFDCFFRL